ncbi:MAG: hypothetical protein R3A10_17440 [Caldilineaceae bacterium]
MEFSASGVNAEVIAAQRLGGVGAAGGAGRPHRGPGGDRRHAARQTAWWRSAG